MAQDFFSKMLQLGIDPYHLEGFLKINIKFMRLIQQLAIGSPKQWVKRELQITEAEKLLVIIRNQMYH